MAAPSVVPSNKPARRPAVMTRSVPPASARASTLSLPMSAAGTAPSAPIALAAQPPAVSQPFISHTPPAYEQHYYAPASSQPTYYNPQLGATSAAGYYHPGPSFDSGSENPYYNPASSYYAPQTGQSYAQSFAPPPASQSYSAYHTNRGDTYPAVPSTTQALPQPQPHFPAELVRSAATQAPRDDRGQSYGPPPPPHPNQIPTNLTSTQASFLPAAASAAREREEQAAASARLNAKSVPQTNRSGTVLSSHSNNLSSQSPKPLQTESQTSNSTKPASNSIKPAANSTKLAGSSALHLILRYGLPS